MKYIVMIRIISWLLDYVVVGSNCLIVSNVLLLPLLLLSKGIMVVVVVWALRIVAPLLLLLLLLLEEQYYYGHVYHPQVLPLDHNDDIVVMINIPCPEYCHHPTITLRLLLLALEREKMYWMHIIHLYLKRYRIGIELMMTTSPYDDKEVVVEH